VESGKGAEWARIATRRLRLLRLLEHRDGMSIELVAGVGHSKPPRRAVEQPDAKLGLELLDSVAQRRLGHAKRASRSREAVPRRRFQPRRLQENAMTNQVRPYEPLTSENAALSLVDHQVGLMTGVRGYSTGELKHNIVALAEAAKALNLPIVVTTTARNSMWGPTFPELVEALPGVRIIDRSSVNVFDDPTVARAIETTCRKKLIFAGISLEVCAAFPVITAVGKGLLVGHIAQAHGK
jgi:hypothetical protein